MVNSLQRPSFQANTWNGEATKKSHVWNTVPFMIHTYICMHPWMVSPGTQCQTALITSKPWSIKWNLDDDCKIDSDMWFLNFWSKWANRAGWGHLRTFCGYFGQKYQQFNVFQTLEAPGSFKRETRWSSKFSKSRWLHLKQAACSLFFGSCSCCHYFSLH